MCRAGRGANTGTSVDMSGLVAEHVSPLSLPGLSPAVNINKQRVLRICQATADIIDS